MKILLLGKNGQVGWQLQRALAPLGEIVAQAAIWQTRKGWPLPCAPQSRKSS